MYRQLSRLVVLGTFVVLIAWGVHRTPSVQAQGSASGASSGRVKLLCDLAQAIQWPATNEVLTVALIKYSKEEVNQISNTLARVSGAPWKELWVTNFAVTPKDDYLKALPGQGILAMINSSLDASKMGLSVRSLRERTFLTVGDGYEQFFGMVNLKPGSLVYYPDRFKEKGLPVPVALFESYGKDGGIRVTPAR